MQALHGIIREKYAFELSRKYPGVSTKTHNVTDSSVKQSRG
jgi:hypothetical protein